jgi:hypothetical protein
MPAKEASFAQKTYICDLGGDPSIVNTTLEASLYITTLLNGKKKNTPAPVVPAEVPSIGIYRHDGVIYQVKFNKAKTGVYAKRLVEIGGQRLTETGWVKNIDFEYAAGAINLISPDEKLPFEEAKELSIRYGRCLVCGRHLKDAHSVAEGIGPVCRKTFGPIHTAIKKSDQLTLVA